MKIKNIKINNYGTLKQKEINLENNINIIYGKNESGKSTLLNYLKNIFYGISKNKNGKEISDYEKYLPWVGEEFSGKIKYQLNNGNTFEIFRDFNKKNPIIFNQDLRDVSSDFKIDKKDGNQYFYEQTGIDEKTYISTIMSLQQEVVLNNQNQNILIQKVVDLFNEPRFQIDPIVNNNILPYSRLTDTYLPGHTFLCAGGDEDVKMEKIRLNLIEL